MSALVINDSDDEQLGSPSANGDLALWGVSLPLQPDAPRSNALLQEITVATGLVKISRPSDSDDEIAKGALWSQGDGGHTDRFSSVSSAYRDIVNHIELDAHRKQSNAEFRARALESPFEAHAAFPDTDNPKNPLKVNEIVTEKALTAYTKEEKLLTFIGTVPPTEPLPAVPSKAEETVIAFSDLGAIGSNRASPEADEGVAHAESLKEPAPGRPSDVLSDDRAATLIQSVGRGFLVRLHEKERTGRSPTAAQEEAPTVPGNRLLAIVDECLPPPPPIHETGEIGEHLERHEATSSPLPTEITLPVSDLHLPNGKEHVEGLGHADPPSIHIERPGERLIMEAVRQAQVVTVRKEDLPAIPPPGAFSIDQPHDDVSRASETPQESAWKSEVDTLKKAVTDAEANGRRLLSENASLREQLRVERDQVKCRCVIQ